MDNLSHSTVGLFLGETLHQILPVSKNPENQKRRRWLFLGTSVLANNFPDLDLVFTRLLPKPLGYLLHHRGHTHTLLYLIPQILLLLGLLLLIPKVRKLLKEDSLARKGLALVLVLGFLFHLLCDSLNSYGIHPFYPWNPEWYFGDAVFIVEPFFWASLGIAFGMSLEKRWRRGVFVFSILSFVLTLVGLKLISLFSGAGLVTLAVLVVAAGSYSVKKGLLAGLILFLGCLSTHFIFRNLAYEKITESLKSEIPGAKVYDIALTPLPSNFLCWNFVSLHGTSQQEAIYRKGALNLWGANCSWLNSFAAVSQNQNIQWIQEFSQSTETFRNLAEKNCRFKAWLRFARMPLVDSIQASDLRFFPLRGANFSTMLFSQLDGSDCSGSIPEWGFPRRDLLLGIEK